MNSKFRVVITDHRFPNIDVQKRVFERIGAELITGQAKSEKELIAIAKDADGILTAHSKITGTVIDALTRCKVIVRYGVGVDSIDVPAATRKGIMVSNVPDYCVDEVADHALALILCLARKVVFSARRVQKGEWGFGNLKPLKRLQGQTIGIVGLGRIGRTLARKAIPVGFKIIVYDPYIPASKSEEGGMKFASLETILKDSDIISLHAPLTSETKGMIDKKAFALMKPTVNIVNVSRGPLINEPDLIEALRSGRIAGAGLDVLNEEPPDPANPLLGMEQVIVTSHTAFYSDESMLDLQEKAAEKVADVLSGKVPDPLVNREVLSNARKGA